MFQSSAPPNTLFSWRLLFFAVCAVGLDLLIQILIFVFFLAMNNGFFTHFSPGFRAGEEFFLAFLICLGFMVLYAALESLWGNSPGRALMGLAYVQRLDFSQALSKHFYAFAFVFAVGLILFVLPTPYFYSLSYTGRQWSDLAFRGVYLLLFVAFCFAGAKIYLQSAYSEHVLPQFKQRRKVELHPARLALSFLSLVAFGMIGFALLLPNFVGSCGGGREKVSSVKANMHTFQTIVETYAVDHGGVYAQDVQTLRREAMKSADTSAYWKDFNNPFTNGTGQNYAFANEGESELSGVVTYHTFNAHTGYVLYGYGKVSGQKILDKGQIFELSNS